MQKSLFLWCFLLLGFISYERTFIPDQFRQKGYVEICNNNHGAVTFDSLYAHFDILINFLQANPRWLQKLYIAKERFLRSQDRNYYSTDFFGLYDESNRKGRNQISFYYSVHFHHFICSHYPEFNQIPEIIQFFAACYDIQKSYIPLLDDISIKLDLKKIFLGIDKQPSLLLKIIKYLPEYSITKPHYDGSAFSLFLDSTDNNSLLLSSYKSTFTVTDFFIPERKFFRCFNQNSLILIPGTCLTEFSIYPTPHIVIPTGKTRYATIAFAMRPHYSPLKNEFSPLPTF